MKNCWLGLFSALLLLFPNSLRAQSGPPPLPSGRILNVWEFQNTNWMSYFHDTPICYSNISLVSDWAGFGLLMDSSNAACLNYPIVANTSWTNISLLNGSLEMWFSPDWSSDAGVGNWGTLLEAGNWNTNGGTAPFAWGLYISPNGSNLFFSAQTATSNIYFLNAPISWTGGDWHYLTLTYSSTNTSLYLEGALVATGVGIPTNLSILTNSFSIGSDGNGTGLLQARGIFNNLISYDYQLSAAAISNNFANDSQNVYPLPATGGGFHHDTESTGPPGIPGGGGGGVLDAGPSGPQNSSPVYGTNDFYLQALAFGTNSYNTNANTLTLLLHGTAADISYQLFSTTNLVPPVAWTLEQAVIGSQTTNFTTAAIPIAGRPTLYFKALAATLDADGDGLPDWWEQKYSTISFPLSPTNADTGNTGIQDGDKQDSAGDGYSNLQKYQMGIAPNVFIAPSAPNNFVVNWNTNGNLTLSWTPATNLPSYGAGSLTGYTLTFEGSSISIAANQTNYVLTTNDDVNLALYNQFPGSYPMPTYSLQINYAYTNSLNASGRTALNPDYNVTAYIARGSQGHLYLIASSIPTNIVVFRISADPNNSEYLYPIFNNYNTGWQSSSYALDSFASFDVPVSDLTNGVFQIPDFNVPPYGGYTFEIQPVGSDGNLGQINYCVPFRHTAPDYIPFLDGRTQIQQNINFQLRCATTITQFSVGDPYGTTQSAGTNYVSSGYYSYTDGGMILAATNLSLLKKIIFS